MRRLPKDDLAYSMARLDRIMGRRRLSLNPYTLSDRRLMELARSTGWGNAYDITQFVILTFTRLREAPDWRPFDGIYMRVGEAPEEVFLTAKALTSGVSANDSTRRERTVVDKRILRKAEDVAWLEGKTVFMSRTLRGLNLYGGYSVVYRMHRLRGDTSRDAATIRRAMCAAKTEMLGRILEYPECPDYLDCSKGFFDYGTRIRRALELISRFPDTPVPDD